jgi:hypothetical protein
MTADKLYSTKAAAAYLGMSVANVKHHVYKTKLLQPYEGAETDRLLFAESELDRFNALERKPGPKAQPKEEKPKRPRGRPPKAKPNEEET